MALYDPQRPGLSRFAIPVAAAAGDALRPYLSDAIGLARRRFADYASGYSSDSRYDEKIEEQDPALRRRGNPTAAPAPTPTPESFSSSSMSSYQRYMDLRAARNAALRGYRTQMKEVKPYSRFRRVLFPDGTLGAIPSSGRRYRRSYRRRYRTAPRLSRGRRYRGYGAYETVGAAKGPGSMSMDQNVPQMSNPRGADGAVVISHREYIGDIIAPTSAFNLAYSLRINPSLPSTFPWLSTIAKSFAQYKVEGMVFKFVSTSGALSTTQALGEVVMSVDYNPLNKAPTSKSAMLNDIMAVSKVPSADAECGVECNRLQTANGGLFFTRASADLDADAGDPRECDIGTLYVATQGVSVAGVNSVTLGELWVTYQVALYKQQLPVVTAPDFHCLWGNIPVANSLVNSQWTSGYPNRNTLGLTVTDTVFSFPNQGRPYWVQVTFLTFSDTPGVITAGGFSTTSGVHSVGPDQSVITIPVITPQSGLTDARCTSTYFFEIPVGGGSVNFISVPRPTAPANIYRPEVFITLLGK